MEISNFKSPYQVKNSMAMEGHYLRRKTSIKQSKSVLNQSINLSEAKNAFLKKHLLTSQTSLKNRVRAESKQAVPSFINFNWKNEGDNGNDNG